MGAAGAGAAAGDGEEGLVAVALHLLDNLDAKLHEFTRAIQDDTNSASHWTLYIPRLDRKIFKGSK